MNRVDRVAWAAAGRAPSASPAGGRMPTELALLAVATAGELLGAVTSPLAGAGAAIALVMLLTVRHIRADVRALRAWEP